MIIQKMTLLTFISNQIEYQKGIDEISGFLNHLTYSVLRGEMQILLSHFLYSVCVIYSR